MKQTEKIQKVLARAGFGSRRQLEQLIKDGRIKVNGNTATLGDRISLDDKVDIDGKPAPIKVAAKQDTQVIMYNKPLGEICTRHDPEGRPTVFDKLPKLEVGRWIGVGRLDINSQGLLLFTNNGELANALMHPKSKIARKYLVRVVGSVNKTIISKLLNGALLEDGFAKFDTIERVFNEKDKANQWFKVTVSEGRNRLVRRLWNAEGVMVNRLIRVDFCHIILPRSLRSGSFRHLTALEMKMLKEFTKVI
ncbi:MAG: pseudouridine synthase [Gammaproteobacteria bacterium]|nr:pseudouridine synthase [Gammaproteobacteria bacterium]